MSARCRSTLRVCATAVALLFVHPHGMVAARGDDETVGSQEDEKRLSGQEVVDILSTTSLMMTHDTAHRLEIARVDFLASQADRDALSDLQEDAEFTEAITFRDFELDAIMYLGPTTWTIWLNGEPIKPTQMPEDIRIREVTPRKADVVWFADADNPSDVRNFVLQPGQIYIADTGEVIERSEYDSRNVAAEEIVLEPPGEPASGEAGLPDGAPAPEAGVPALSPEQIEQLKSLKDMLASLPASALSDDQGAQLEQLQKALGDGDGESLSAEQVEELQNFQSLLGGDQ